MSLNKKFTLKIVRGEEIRVLHVVPNTWTELQAALHSMYGTSDFQITYVDEESDHITVANDLDYSEALQFHSDRPSMKLFFKPRSLAEDFEELKLEEPAEKKDQSFARAEAEEPPSRGWRGRGGRCRGMGMGRPHWGRTEGAEEPNRGWRCRGGPDFINNMMRQGPELINSMMRGGPEALNNMVRGGPWCKGMKRFFKKMHKNKFGKHHNKLYKMKVLQKGFPRRWVVGSGTDVVISWTVLNKGSATWPEGSFVQNFGGTFGQVESVPFGEVKPGEIVNIVVNVSVPVQQGKHKGVWGVMVNGECVGVLKAKLLAAAETVDAKAVTLESMGFNRELAVRALEESNGDLDLAISSILKNYQA